MELILKDSIIQLDLACIIAVEEVSKYLLNNESRIKKVVFVCFDEENFELYKNELEIHMIS